MNEQERQKIITETIKQQWIKHIDFLSRHRRQAKVAREPVYLKEMSDSLECYCNWFKNIYGEKELKKYL